MIKLDIRQVHSMEYQQFLKSLSTTEGIQLSANEKGLLDAISDMVSEGEMIYGAFHQGNLVGCIGFGEEEFTMEHHTHVKETLIGTLFVHPLYRDQGIGKRLVQYTMGQAGTSYVIADPVDEKAHQFFAECGFTTNHLFDMQTSGDWLMVSRRQE